MVYNYEFEFDADKKKNYEFDKSCNYSGKMCNLYL